MGTLLAIQLAPGVQSSGYTIGSERSGRDLPLLLPFAAALLSTTVLVTRLGIYLVYKRTPNTEDDASNAQEPRLGALNRAVERNGGIAIFWFMLARIIGCIALVGASVPAVFENVSDEWWTNGSWGIQESEFLPVSLLLANLYALSLACIAVRATGGWRKWIIRHKIAVLLVELGVYMYRDLWPLATFEEAPLDLAEGWLLWVKVGSLVFTAIVVPLCVPSIYVPVDGKIPRTAGLHPEKTASVLSHQTYSYLSPTIRAANKTTHLTVDQLPPMAEYDQAHVLAKRSLRYLSPAELQKGRHIFFGLLRMFASDYVYAIVTMTVYSLSKFAAPIAVNRLLTLLESERTQETTVRPWFWIFCLFAGPVSISLAFHSYCLVLSRTAAQGESILTQLIFEHSLRVRVKTDSPENTPTTPSVPDNVLGAEENAGQESSNAPPTNSTATEASGGAAEIDGQTPKAPQKADGPPTKSKSDEGAPSFIGKLNNLVTIDVSNVSDAADLVKLFYVLPTQIIGCSYLLYVILGWSAFVGLATMVALLPVPGYMTKLLRDVQVEKMKRTDNRTQTVTESMNVLRMIKLFGWEEKIHAKITQRREEELTWVWKRKVLNLLIGGVTYWVPTVTMLATFATATLIMKMELTASKVFSSMIVFNMMGDELQGANYLLSIAVRGKVSLDRLNAFFKETELLDSYEDSDYVSVNADPEGDLENDTIGFRHASFTWTPEGEPGSSTPSSQFKLKVPGELQFAKGKINMIVGPIGSGKTSLLMALLGEMHFTRSHPDSTFNLPRGGGVSFAVQESWVQNDTIRDNILFHSPYNEERYKKVLYQCALEPDLELFEAGDMTEVGERGLTLSGGQKVSPFVVLEELELTFQQARLTLARAIYSRSQIILLDDVLAALDVHTAIWIVKKCFQGDLVHGRTVLLVTHNIALASPIAEFIVSVSPDGVVTGRGQDISAVLRSEPELQAEYQQDKIAIAEEDQLLDPPLAKENPAAGKLIVAEEVQEGNVSWKTIKVFLQGLGGRHLSSYASIWLALTLGEFFMGSFNLWFLGYWGSQYERQPPGSVHVVQYLWTYIGLSFLTMSLIISKDIWYVLGTLRLSRTIHTVLSRAILGTTLRWLDQTPISRIIARMTQDINTLDFSLVSTAETFGNLFLMMVVNLISAVWFVPLFTLPGIGIAIIGMYIGKRFLKAQLSVKRELSNAQAPMLAHFAAAMAGLVSIRAYGAQSAFKNESRKRIDHYVRIFRLNRDLNRWIGIRLDTLGAMFSAALATYLTYGSNIGASNVGFSLNRAVAFCSLILWVVRIFTSFQVQANSLERIIAYSEIEQEPKATESGKPPASWPKSGEIRVEKLTARYSKAGPAILHGLSFEIRSGERIGVVGRTGSGKSSLTLALLRCILTDGTVYFDGLPTDQINLDALRSNITIIPQLPELLSGTLRNNLDPFDEYDDATLNAALRASGLNASHNLNGAGEGRLGLDSNITSGGGNVSVGQRQIIALARAIVRSSKLLILDEATSAIDHETDSIIQNTLRKELGSDVTVLTIAHRLQTIIDADRIMVLEAGHIVEFAPPADLLAKERGAFKALVDESGDKQRLYEAAGLSIGGSSPGSSD